MKYTFSAVVGIIGGALTALLGGWDLAIQTLLIFMGIDYITGLMIAGIFHKSPKTKSGSLSSLIGWKGLCRKCRRTR